MASNRQCLLCFSNEIIRKNGENVCGDCGCVMDEEMKSTTKEWTLTTGMVTEVDARQTTVLHDHFNQRIKGPTTYHRTDSNRRSRLSEAVKNGMVTIRNVSRLLNIRKSIEESSIELYKKIVSKRLYKFSSQNIKQCLALSCLYLVANQEGTLVTISDLCSNTDAVLKHFGTVYFQLFKMSPELNQQQQENFLETHVPYYAFRLNPLEEKNRLLMIDYGTTLVWMWRQVCLVQSFHPVTVIYASLFYSWKAVHLAKARAGVKDFFATFNIQASLTVMRRIKFYYFVLLDFINCSPLSATESITPENIAFRLKEIIKMKRIIVFNYNQNSQLSTCRFSKKQSKAAKASSGENDGDSHGDGGGGHASSSSSPPSPKRVKHQHSQGSVATTTTTTTSTTIIAAAADNMALDDFSDSEIDAYIRSEDEVKQIENLQFNV